MGINARHLVTSERGLSLVELAMTLAVTAILSGVAVPAVQDYVDEARVTRAVQDTHAIATAVARFTSDVIGQHANVRAWELFDVLVGAGAIPAVGANGDAAWVAPAESAEVGSLDEQLVTNGPNYSSSPRRQAGGIRGWHGPYLEAGVGPDPWGNRYAINVQALSNGASCTVVVSAGPNGLIETTFEGAVILAGGDDVAALVSPRR